MTSDLGLKVVKSFSELLSLSWDTRAFLGYQICLLPSGPPASLWTSSSSFSSSHKMRFSSQLGSQRQKHLFQRGTSQEPATGQQVAKSLQKTGDSTVSTCGGERTRNMSKKKKKERRPWLQLLKMDLENHTHTTEQPCRWAARIAVWEFHQESQPVWCSQ